MRILPYIFLFLFLCSCIDEYTPKGTKSFRQLLVVEGIITNEESVIRLSRSMDLDASFAGKTTVNNASVYVETDNGKRLVGVFSGKGTYVVSTGDLEADRKYRLYITVDGEEYCSDYLSPIFTTGIDSITSVKEGLGEPVHIYVHSHDPDDRSRYYMWNYKEIWEISADLSANYGPWEDGFILYNDLKNTYYCWIRDSSKSLIMASSEKLSANVIAHKKIKEIPCDNQRLSLLYYIEVSQNQVRKETYDYFVNVQKNVEQTGDLFSSIPSELKGNIRCMTNPEQLVIGYCEVTTTTRKEFYIDLYKNYYEPAVSLCPDSITNDHVNYGYPVYAYFIVPPPMQNADTLFAPHKCVDCRLMPGATKNKPDFWPNDHH